MISFLSSLAPAIRVSRGQLFRGLSILGLTFALSSALMAQADPAAGDNGNGGGRRGQRGQNGGGGNGGGRGNFDPAQMQERMMTMLREQFEVTDDAEWKLISDKLTALNELRRTAGGGFGGRGGFAGFGGPGGGQGGGGNRGGRGGVTGNPEQDALRQAITDKAPDAEIKSRLARLREVRKANEEKLTKAQEELRALLSVRQEAVAVMAGYLP